MSDRFEPGGGRDEGLVQLGGVGLEGHTTEHLREAVGVTARGDGDKVEIQLGHFCNNRCVFCVSGQLTERGLAPKIPTEPVFAALEAAADTGVRKLILLGGEPTIQRSFLPTLRHAVSLGYDDIVIFTNGVRSWKTGFMEEVATLGRFTWRFSIQGADEATHDAVVGRRGAFERIRRGLAWLRERRQDITANMCVNSLSYPSLPQFPELLDRYGVRQLHIDVVRPNGTGVRSDDELRSIMPRYTDMVPAFEAMLGGFEARPASIEVNVGNLPFCAMPAQAHRIHHGGEQTTTVTTDDKGQLGRVWDKYRYQRTGMVFGPECPDCAFSDVCRGVPEKYAEFYGLDELIPLDAAVREDADRRREALHRRGQRASDPSRELAGVLARVRRLRAAGPFGDWVWAGSRSTPQGDGVVVGLVGPGDASFELWLRARTAEFKTTGGTTPEVARPGIEAVAAALE